MGFLIIVEGLMWPCCDYESSVLILQKHALSLVPVTKASRTQAHQPACQAVKIDADIKKHLAKVNQNISKKEPNTRYRKYEKKHVAEIRQKLANGTNKQALAAEYGISRTTLYSALETAA